jgi:hypothetical protein
MKFLYGPLSPSRPLVPSTALCLLYALRPYLHLYGPLLQMALNPVYDSLSPLRPSVILYGPLSSLQLSVLSTTLYPLYGCLSPLRPSVPSTALCLLYGPQSPL